MNTRAIKLLSGRDLVDSEQPFLLPPPPALYLTDTCRCLLNDYNTLLSPVIYPCPSIPCWSWLEFHIKSRGLTVEHHNITICGPMGGKYQQDHMFMDQQDPICKSHPLRPHPANSVSRRKRKNPLLQRKQPPPLLNHVLGHTHICGPTHAHYLPHGEDTIRNRLSKHKWSNEAFVSISVQRYCASFGSLPWNVKRVSTT